MQHSDKKLLGGLYGAIVGDALGVPYEFHGPGEIPPANHIVMDPTYPGFSRSYDGVPPGTWSDDTSLLLCLLDAKLEQPEDWAPAFVGRAQAWRFHGLYAVDGKKFDIGMQTAAALSDLLGGADPLARTDDASANGNGGLMRVMGMILPLLVTGVEPAEMFDACATQSIPTHAHAISRMCCGLYGVTALYVYRGDPVSVAVTKAIEFATNHVSSDVAALNVVLDAETNRATGSGYVVDTFWTAVKCLLDTTTYEGAVKRAIMYGNDTDTTACAVGGLAGLMYGYDNIPAEWLEQLRGKEIVEPLINCLLGE
jgi:ADP-ribosyl-[dinitrogen reductase] hydrolase